ncbi:ScbR family autoregulator-binding transcription factor [Streptomyces sp. NPDC006658]|uniref:ScbR family autoregulator-binding transcription factor n=1 Tax=unclassified Streptomyces TaxID=2593676 RepID=UPI003403523C
MAQERAIRTRKSIVVAAAEVFAEVGYEAATVAQILLRAKVTKGALYFHFASKEELAQAVLADQITGMPPVPPRTLMLQRGLDEAFLLAYLLQQGDPLVRAGVRLAVEPGSPADGLDRSVPMREWVDHNVETLAAAERNGELMPHVDIDTAASMFVGAFTGVQMLSKMLTNHADLVERVAQLQQHLMSSMAVPTVFVQLDMAPDRGRRVYQETTELNRIADDGEGAVRAVG